MNQSCAAISPDGRLLLAGNQDESATLWDMKSGKKILRFHAEFDPSATCVEFSPPDGRRALTGSNHASVRFWDVATGKELKSYETPEGWINSVSFSPDGRFALSGGNLKTWLWVLPK